MKNAKKKKRNRTFVLMGLAFSLIYNKLCVIF